MRAMISLAAAAALAAFAAGAAESKQDAPRLLLPSALALDAKAGTGAGVAHWRRRHPRLGRRAARRRAGRLRARGAGRDAEGSQPRAGGAARHCEAARDPEAPVRLLRAPHRPLPPHRRVRRRRRGARREHACEEPRRRTGRRLERGEIGPLRDLPIVNGPRGTSNPQRQGLQSAVLGEGSALNITQSLPGGRDYSPIWDVHPAVWSESATPRRLTSAAQVAAEVRAGRLTSGGMGPANASLGGLKAAQFISNCPTIAIG